MIKLLSYVEFEEYVSILADLFPNKKEFYDNLRFAVESDSDDVVDEIWTMGPKEFKRKVKKYKRSLKNG